MKITYFQSFLNIESVQKIKLRVVQELRSLYFFLIFKIFIYNKFGFSLRGYPLNYWLSNRQYWLSRKCSEKFVQIFICICRHHLVTLFDQVHFSYYMQTNIKSDTVQYGFNIIKLTVCEFFFFSIFSIIFWYWFNSCFVSNNYFYCNAFCFDFILWTTLVS